MSTSFSYSVRIGKPWVSFLLPTKFRPLDGNCPRLYLLGSCFRLNDYCYDPELMNRRALYRRSWSISCLLLVFASCTTRPEVVLDTNPAGENPQVSNAAGLQSPIYSPLPKVIGDRVDTLLGTGSMLMQPHQPPMLYEFPLRHGCCLLPQEVE